MRILSHRGYWLHREERNLRKAFQCSFDLGYGTETDVRDHAGKLVIAHDMPTGEEIGLDALLDIMAGRNLPLAINIKADGLAQNIEAMFARYSHSNWFAFDMAIPDMRAYLQASICTYTRQSEVEPVPIWLAQAGGVWLDGFESVWFSNTLIIEHLRNGKPVCVVSSELHGREHLPLWEQLKALKTEEHLTLCTDFPEAATHFFK